MKSKHSRWDRYVSVKADKKCTGNLVRNPLRKRLFRTEKKTGEYIKMNLKEIDYYGGYRELIQGSVQ
jgi:hypothetical protein